MNNDDHSGVDHSVYLYRVLGQKLVSRDTALGFAKLLLSDRFGDSEVQLQNPLTVEEAGDTWVVHGARQPDFDDGLPDGVLRRGKAEIVISQVDGRILKFAIDGALAPLPDAISPSKDN